MFSTYRMNVLLTSASQTASNLAQRTYATIQASGKAMQTAPGLALHGLSCTAKAFSREPGTIVSAAFLGCYMGALAGAVINGTIQEFINYSINIENLPLANEISKELDLEYPNNCKVGINDVVEYICRRFDPYELRSTLNSKLSERMIERGATPTISNPYEIPIVIASGLLLGGFFFWGSVKAVNKRHDRLERERASPPLTMPLIRLIKK